MEYDVIVIGAGVGGLFSAFELSRKGKRVLLLERQSVPGGYATSFQRKGFTFESSVHCVDALGPGQEMRTYLEDSGILSKITLIDLKNFSRIIYPEHDFVTDFNRDNFLAYLKEKFPQEEDNLNKLFGNFDKFYVQFDRFQNSCLPNWLKYALVPFICPRIIITSCLTINKLIRKFVKDDKLIAIITDIWRFMGTPPTRLSAFYFLMIFRGYFYNSTAYVKSGFMHLFKVMAQELIERGSEVKFNTMVKTIVTNKGKSVKSVIIENGEEFMAKVIISNANAIDTLAKLPDDAGVRQNYLKELSGLEKSLSAVQVYLGLSVPARTLGMNEAIFSINTTYDHDQDFQYSLLGDYQNCAFEITDHAQVDPDCAERGKGNLLIITFDSYRNWENLSQEEYKAKKAEVAKKLISRAEKYLPGLSKNIEVMEIATPRTMYRYTLSPEGAIYGFAQTLNQSSIRRLGQKTAIKGLILAGAWTFPGAGVHGCFVSGLEAADLAMKYLK